MTDQPSQSASVLNVTASHHDQRLDNFLIHMFPGIPKSRIYRAIRKGEVRINKGRAKALSKVLEGDSVRIPPPFHQSVKKPNHRAVGTALELDPMIIYEDDHIMVINKPSGMAVHGGSGVSFGVIELVRHVRPKHDYYELAHRIDKDTSGCLLIAKKRSTLKAIHDLFTRGYVTKEYLAVVHGHWPKTLHKIDLPLRRDLHKSGERLAAVDHDIGKYSLTYFTPLKHGVQTTLLKVKPKTGRMHQIRVHCLACDHPIVGDPKYRDRQQTKRSKYKRMGLHAHRLSFKLDSLDKQYDFIVPVDSHFDELIN
jgi:23S rRNA pseudouridine955/2504/2580 synthase